MDIIDKIPAADLLLVRSILSHRCSIFGGYLRDIIAGVSPRDIDVIVPEWNIIGIVNMLRNMGYTIRGDVEDPGPNVITCIHPYKIEVELHSYYDDPTIYLYCDQQLDFDVNSLALCFSDERYILYRWDVAHPYSKEDVNICDHNVTDNIIKNIQARTADCFRYDKQRMDKLITKGYTINFISM